MHSGNLDCNLQTHIRQFQSFLMGKKGGNHL